VRVLASAGNTHKEEEGSEKRKANDVRRKRR